MYIWYDDRFTQMNGQILMKWLSGSSGDVVQIKSNHFYCHITTAQVPWWVKFLWACSRQCRKTTDNLPMDRQCKKNNRQFTYGQTVQKTALEHLQCSRQCKKTTTAIYIWTDSAKNCTGAFTVYSGNVALRAAERAVCGTGGWSLW